MRLPIAVPRIRIIIGSAMAAALAWSERSGSSPPGEATATWLAEAEDELDWTAPPLELDFSSLQE